MKCMTTMFRLLPVAAACLAAAPALATNGYFAHGYGLKAKGMGGASTAMAQDSLGGATNPAAMVWVGNRIDLGADIFMPKRDAQRSGTAALPGVDGKVDSDRTAFLVPEFGYNRMMGSDWSLGVSVYGNGGLNTTYPQGPFQCPTGPTTAAPATPVPATFRKSRRDIPRHPPDNPPFIPVSSSPRFPHAPAAFPDRL